MATIAGGIFRCMSFNFLGWFSLIAPVDALQQEHATCSRPAVGVVLGGNKADRREPEAAIPSRTTPAAGRIEIT